MTFTYDPGAATPTDVTRVRAYIGDTVEDEAYLTDEEINLFIADGGTWQAAVVLSIKAILRKLSQPNFRADWLQMDYKAARDGFKDALKEARREFNVSAVSSSSQAVYRSDSLQDEAPDW